MVGNTAQDGLDLTWTLDFESRGRQGRVRAKVRRLDEAVEVQQGGRTLRPRQTRSVAPTVEDDDDDDDDDFEDEESSDDDDEDESQFEEGPSEHSESSRERSRR